MPYHQSISKDGDFQEAGCCCFFLHRSIWTLGFLLQNTVTARGA